MPMETESSLENCTCSFSVNPGQNFSLSPGGAPGNETEYVEQLNVRRLPQARPSEGPGGRGRPSKGKQTEGKSGTLKITSCGALNFRAAFELCNSVFKWK